MAIIATLSMVLFLSACQTVLPTQPSRQANRSDSAQSIPSTTELTSRWIVSASEAQALARSGATILDVRSWQWTDIPGASIVTWQQFSQDQDPHRGKLKANDVALSQQLQDLGISSQTPVLVVGEPRAGWGEEGRIVWMLRTLGHQQAYMVDGGVHHLRQVSPLPQRTAKGNFTVQRDHRWTIDQLALKQQLQAETIQIIDSREPREFSGKTPYGEQRGGHLKHAKNLYFKDLLDTTGTLLPRPELIAKIEQKGITMAKPVVVYCTGGIRSGWLTTVLVSLGYQAKNYPGSMWEWSTSPAIQYPLFKSAQSD